MKTLLFLIAISVSSTAYAQITLEHTYPPTVPMRYALVDTNDVKFFWINSLSDTVVVYNADHSLYKEIPVPVVKSGYVKACFYLSRHLFNTDDKLEVLVSLSPSQVLVINEDGTVIFECDKCELNYPFQNGTDAIPESLVNTQFGAKLILIDSLQNTDVYSLPGMLPGLGSTLGVPTDPTVVDPILNQPSVYPNPNNGNFKLSYSLPNGASNGDLIIMTADGREIKQYHIGNAFNDLIIPDSDLPNGAYFYKISTSQGDSKTEKLVVIR